MVVFMSGLEYATLLALAGAIVCVAVAHQSHPQPVRDAAAAVVGFFGVIVLALLRLGIVSVLLPLRTFNKSARAYLERYTYRGGHFRPSWA